MKVVTGGCGFIGSNLIHALNQQGETDILVVDDLTQGTKCLNIATCDIVDYMDKQTFLNQVKNKQRFAESIEIIFHQGACSATVEWDGKYMMENNYEYSKHLFHYCTDQRIPFIYASSAGVYGLNSDFSENNLQTHPLTIYGYSKALFDRYIQQQRSKFTHQVVGLRYFNVYGPREQHKGNMASVPYHLHQQLLTTQTVKLFAGSHGYKNGEHQRDFIFVDDVIKVNLWFWQHPEKSGIFNVGTGENRSFNAIAEVLLQWHRKGKVEYIPFPASLEPYYQPFTKANIQALRQAGYSYPFYSLEEGITTYLNWLTEMIN